MMVQNSKNKRSVTYSLEEGKGRVEKSRVQYVYS
jgi:hypothetical protein